MKKLTLLLILCFGITSSTAFAQEDTEAEELADYKTACLAAIDNISLIGDNFAIRSMISVAKTALSVCQTKDAMRRTMTTLRAGVLGYLQTTSTFPDGQVYTGLAGNHSFDTGDLSLWYCIGFDLSQIGLTDLVNAIGGGDVSGLMNAVSVNEWNEDTKAIENQGSNAVQGGQGKYYLGSNQLLMQPILGLPAGIYSLNAKVACAPGFLNLNKVYLNALVVPTSTVQEVLGDIIGDTSNWSELFNNFDLSQYMAPFLQSGKLYSGSANCKSLSTFSDGELRFIIDEGDIVIIGINAGMLPFIGTEQFRADNLQLVGLRAADGILSLAKANLGEALQEHTAIEANYNADAEDTSVQPAFSFDKTLTENYNEALRSAQDKYDHDKLADILTKNDLNNLDGLDATLKSHYSKDIQTLNTAKGNFDRQAFIAPATDESFNIVMKDSWISLTSKWTDNAVSIDEDFTLRFSQQPGQSVFALAFGFERASNTYTNQLRAFVHDYRDKYYLGKTDAGIVLTADPSEAVIITAKPSYTKEGEIRLMIGDLYLGTSSSSDALIETNTGTLLRPTRTGLTVLPASEMQFTVTIPTGQDAGTLILPFDADLPEGVNALTVSSIETMDEDHLTSYLVHLPSSVIHANTPYIIMAAEGDYTFSGVPHALRLAYDEGLLTGRHTSYTTQGGNEYKLTAEDGYSVFRQLDGQTIAESECYLKCDCPSDIIFVNKTDAATGIKAMDEENAQRSMANGQPVYNLVGQRLSKPLRGLNIIGKRKMAY